MRNDACRESADSREVKDDKESNTRNHDTLTAPAEPVDKTIASALVGIVISLQQID